MSDDGQDQADVPEPELGENISEAQQDKFRWGVSISEAREAELGMLTDEQRKWAALPVATRGRSVFEGLRLPGAFVFSLAWKTGQSGDEFQNLHLEGADLYRAHLEEANLSGAHLEMVTLGGAHLEGAELTEVHLERAGLGGARLERARLYSAHLEGAYLREAHLEGALLKWAHLEGADLRGAHLEGADLTEAHLEGADLSRAHLKGKRMPTSEVQLLQQWKHFPINKDFPEILLPTGLRLAFFSSATSLHAVILGDADYGFVRVADVRWGGVNLAVVKWMQQDMGSRRKRLRVVALGDEWRARSAHDENGKPMDALTKVAAFEDAVRANRQLATALRDQGLNEDADRFAYRAQVLQRNVLRRQGNLLPAVGSWLLDTVAGYGYKPMRSVFTYIVVVVTFAAAYFVLGGTHGTLSWNEALVVSMTAFHGRGFFGSAFQPGDPQAAVAAVEALIGLLIEITFIATFTQRFFAR